MVHSTFKKHCQTRLAQVLSKERTWHSGSILCLLLAIGILSFLAGWLWVDTQFLHIGVSPNVILVLVVLAALVLGLRSVFISLYRDTHTQREKLEISLASARGALGDILPESDTRDDTVSSIAEVPTKDSQERSN